MRDTLLTKPGIGRGLPDGVVVTLNPQMADALAAVVAAEITADVVEDEDA